MMDIFSANVERRYRATCEHSTSDSSAAPYGCSGAANAYLVLVSPSPGEASDGQVIPESDHRPNLGKLCIGKNAMNFNWGNPEGTKQDARYKRWTGMCSHILGGDAYVFALTALFNLDWTHSADQKTLSKERLREGWEKHVWPLIQKVKPVILCPLTNQVWNIMYHEFRGFHMRLVSLSRNVLSKSRRRNRSVFNSGMPHIHHSLSNRPTTLRDIFLRLRRSILSAKPAIGFER